mgnify:CR=1 FL=1
MDVCLRVASWDPGGVLVLSVPHRGLLAPLDAATVAQLMAEAELQGSDGHGVIRLLPYARRIRAGGINLRPDIKNVAKDSRCFELRTYTVREGSSLDRKSVV